MKSWKLQGFDIPLQETWLSSSYCVCASKAFSWLAIGISLVKLLKIALFYSIFQRKLILKHQKFNFITSSVCPLSDSYAILELDFANDEHLKTEYITLMWKQKMTPCYLVIHICTLSFLHSLIQKLRTIFGFLFLPQYIRSPHIPKELPMLFPTLPPRFFFSPHIQMF